MNSKSKTQILEYILGEFLGLIIDESKYSNYFNYVAIFIETEYNTPLK